MLYTKSSCHTFTLASLKGKYNKPTGFLPFPTERNSDLYFYGSDTWTDGTDVFVDPQNTGKYTHKLNKEKDTWEGCPLYKNANWTDGTNLYYSYTSEHYVREGNKWVEKHWEGIEDITYFNADCIWSDGVNIYYSDDGSNTTYGTKINLVLKDGKWETTTWSGLEFFVGRAVWTDDINIYCNYGSKSYILNGNTWEPKVWKGLDQPNSLWTDGTNIYHSSGRKHYILKGDTWEEKLFDGCPQQMHYDYFWTDGDNVYYSNLHNERYVLVENPKLYLNTTYGGWRNTCPLSNSNTFTVNGKLFKATAQIGWYVFISYYDANKEGFTYEDDGSGTKYVKYKGFWLFDEDGSKIEYQSTIIAYHKYATESEGDSDSGAELNLQNKTVTQNGTYTADDGYDALGTITVNVEGGGTAPTGTLEITEHGTYDVTNYASVEVYGTYELKPLTVTKNGVYENPDVDGYDKVTVNVPTYVSVTSIANLPSDAEDGTIAIVG